MRFDVHRESHDYRRRDRYSYRWPESRTQDGSQSSNDHVTDIFKDCDLYKAAKTGNLDAFRRTLVRLSAEENASLGEILRRLSPAGNTFLHIAAKFGNADIVTYIVEEDPSLVVYKNSHKETALHLAAKGGCELTVTALVEIHKRAQALSSHEAEENKSEAAENTGEAEENTNKAAENTSEAEENEGEENTSEAESEENTGEAEENNVLRAQNVGGNTALHEALICGPESIAEYLIQEDPEVSCYQNENGESALYLAAKVGSAKCVTTILKSSTDPEQINKLFEKRSPFEAAVMGKHKDVLEAMLTANPSLRDGQGRTPLHYAASLGYLQEVQSLLDQYAPSATQKDKSGSLPIHLASINGHVDVIKVLLNDCPDAGELLNKDGHNVLHLAALNGRCNVARYILNNPHLTDLINMKDKFGNAPLHLATSYGGPKIVFDFTWDRRVDVTLVNNQGLTALDRAEYDMGSYNPSFPQRLIWAALKAAGTPRSVSGETVGRAHFRGTLNMDKYKDRVNTLLLVSILVATITFAAGFTLPGGYNSSSDTDLGIATMLREKGFQVFIFCDTMAMHSSIIVAVALIWAQLGDPELMCNALNLMVPLLGVALGLMSLAFTAGVFLAVRKLRWLSTSVLVMGITFLAILSVLIIPLCIPFASSNRILRYMCYYPFCLVILASSRGPKDQQEEQPVYCSARL